MVGKKRLFLSKKIYLSKSLIPKAGRGVFAAVDIKKGEIIERCPIIKIPTYDVELLRQSELINYYFLWGENFIEAAIALGLGSIYNNSDNANAAYKKKDKEMIIEISATIDIKKGEEITISYNSGNLEWELNYRKYGIVDQGKTS